CVHMCEMHFVFCLCVCVCVCVCVFVRASCVVSDGSLALRGAALETRGGSLSSRGGKNKSAKTERSTKAGVIFPVGRMLRYIRRSLPKYRIGAGAPVYLAAVLEYLTGECVGVCVISWARGDSLCARCAWLCVLVGVCVFFLYLYDFVCVCVCVCVCELPHRCVCV